MNTRLDRMQSRADEIEQYAGRWLELVALGDMTADEIASFEAWKAQAVAHHVAYVRLEAVWRQTERLAALRRPAVSEPSAKPQNGNWSRIRYAVALAMFVVVGAGYSWWGQRTPELAYTTAVGGHKIIKLADGSGIELNTDSSIRVQLDGHSRKVTLDKGEAYFEITHDPQRPFTVLAAGHRIVDLGTKFAVRERDDSLRVSLVEGRARLELTPSSQVHSAVLNPGDVATATADKISVRPTSRQLMTNQLGWRRGVIVFDNTPLTNAVEEVNRYNHTKLVVAGTSISRLTITGTFPANDVDIVLEAARDVYGLRVESRGGRILISR